MDRTRNTCAPVVSILTPAYDHASWIGTCVEIVQRQTFQDWEHIIIDDSSTDGTADASAPFLTDPRITYIRQENRGIWRLADTYNAGLRASSGRFVAILEGDDFWLPDKLAAQLPSFDDDAVGLSYGRILIADDQDHVLDGESARWNQWVPPYESFAASEPYPFLRDLLMLGANMGAVTLMARRSALDDIGGFQQPPYFSAIDYTTLLRLAVTHRAAFVDRPLGVWRRHPGQTTDVNGLNYALGHTRAAIECFRSRPEPVHGKLGISEEDIRDGRRDYLANAYWAATRSHLRAHRWPEARRCARELVRCGNTLPKAEGSASFLAATVHLDPNPIIQRGARLRPLRTDTR